MGNEGFTNDHDGLLLDNNAFDQKKTSIAVAVSTLDFNESAFEMEDAACGTEALLLLSNQWHDVTKTTADFKVFYSENVDPFISKVNKSINVVNISIYDALKYNECDEKNEFKDSGKGAANGIKSATAAIREVGEEVGERIKKGLDGLFSRIPKYDDLYNQFNRGKDLDKGTTIKKSKNGIDLFKKLVSSDEYKLSLGAMIIEPKYTYKLEKSETEHALITTSFSLDLLQNLNMTLLESHTGVIKSLQQFHTKFSASAHDFSAIPFNDVTLFMLGDKTLVKGWSAKVRAKVSSMASENKWTYRTTRDKVKADLSRDFELSPLVSLCKGF